MIPHNSFVAPIAVERPSGNPCMVLVDSDRVGVVGWISVSHHRVATGIDVTFKATVVIVS